MTIGVHPVRDVVINGASVLQTHAFNALRKQVKGGVHGVAQGEGFGLNLDFPSLQL